jgi:hypothetical protein
MRLALVLAIVLLGASSVAQAQFTPFQYNNSCENLCAACELNCLDFCSRSVCDRSDRNNACFRDVSNFWNACERICERCKRSIRR